MISYRKTSIAENQRSISFSPRSSLDTASLVYGTASPQPAPLGPACHNLHNAQSTRLMQALMASRLASRLSATGQVIPHMPFPPSVSAASHVSLQQQKSMAPRAPAGLDLLRAVSLSVPNTTYSAKSSMSTISSAPSPLLIHNNNKANNSNNNVCVPLMAANMMSERVVPRATVVARFLAARSQRIVDNTAAESGERVYIDQVKEFDVLCGRGGKTNHHNGNKRYRQVVNEMKLMYRRTEAKTLKTDLSKAIVEHVCNYGGRFVKLDTKSGKYFILTKTEARKKTSQALREMKVIKWTK